MYQQIATDGGKSRCGRCAQNQRAIFFTLLFAAFFMLMLFEGGRRKIIFNSMEDDENVLLSYADILQNEIYGGEAPQIALKGISNEGNGLLESSKKTCPNWSDNMRETFGNKCGFWLDSYAKWLSAAQKNKNNYPLRYACWNEAECHGLGDRLAGIQGVFSLALESSRQFRIDWQGLDKLFSTCVFDGYQAADWKKKVNGNSCKIDAKNCEKDRGMLQSCKQNHAAFENLDRACLPAGICSYGKEFFPDTLNAANIYGCSLRALMEPTDFFRNYEIPFHIGANGLKTMKLYEAEEYMKKYYVIGIHFRVGDQASFIKPGVRQIDSDHKIFQVPFQCASTLQSYLEGRTVDMTVPVAGVEDLKFVRKNDDDEYTVEGRPVRWFLASDSNSLREMALDLFGDKLLMITTRPSHIAFTRDRSSVLADTFAEWYLLGLSDSLVLNRIGGKNLFRGRLSSYSKTTWTYQLKNIFYDAGTCRRRQILLDGTWKVAPHECTKQYSFHHRLTQPHMTIANITFPKTWIDRGQVLTYKELLDENQEDEDDTPDEDPEP